MIAPGKFEATLDSDYRGCAYLAAAYLTSYLSGKPIFSAVAVGAVIGDIISGSTHFILDYWPIDRRELAWHHEDTIPAVQDFQANELYLTSSEWDRFLWQFHSHHDVPYPSDRPVIDLITENLKFGIPVCLSGVAAASFGYAPPVTPWSTCIAGATGVLSQGTHFLAHARNHGFMNNWFIEKLQDYGLLLSPEEHRTHHTRYDRNFCIFNGWANPLINFIREMLTIAGVSPKMAPTVQLHIERCCQNLHCTTEEYRQLC
jgi:hypothetical protein